MAKKTEKQQDGRIINIPQHMLDALGIDKDTEVDMLVIGDELIIRPTDRAAAEKKRKERLVKSANRIMDQYESVLKKLSKT